MVSGPNALNPVRIPGVCFGYPTGPPAERSPPGGSCPFGGAVTLASANWPVQNADPLSCPFESISYQGNPIFYPLFDDEASTGAFSSIIIPPLNNNDTRDIWSLTVSNFGTPVQSLGVLKEGITGSNFDLLPTSGQWQLQNGGFSSATVRPFIQGVAPVYQLDGQFTQYTHRIFVRRVNPTQMLRVRWINMPSPPGSPILGTVHLPGADYSEEHPAFGTILLEQMPDGFDPSRGNWITDPVVGNFPLLG